MPPELVPIYESASSRYRLGERGVPVLAAINKIESGFGENMGPSSAGAVGWMQFMPATWAAYGVDADGDGARDPDDPDDAIHAAANYLRASGAPRDWYRAVFAYNHADWYVQQVLALADGYQGACTLTLEPAVSLGDLDFGDTAGPWGGSQKFAQALAALGEPYGCVSTSEKRERKYTSSGGISDHWVGSTDAYAVDIDSASCTMAYPGGEADRTARAIAAALGMPAHTGIVNVVRGAYRFQLLWQTDGHYDHVHIGVRRVGLGTDGAAALPHPAAAGLGRARGLRGLVHPRPGRSAVAHPRDGPARANGPSGQGQPEARPRPRTGDERAAASQAGTQRQDLPLEELRRLPGQGRRRRPGAAVRIPLALSALLGLALLALRLAGRRRRRYARHWLVPYRADEATPGPGPPADRELAPDGAAALVAAAAPAASPRSASSCTRSRTTSARASGSTSPCPTSRVRPRRSTGAWSPATATADSSQTSPSCWWLRAVVRLKKRRSFTTRLATPERYDSSLVDSLVATMVACGEPCTVQYALTPTFAWFDRFARWLFRSEERELERARVGAEGADPGIRSEVAQQELEGGLEVQHRPLFFADLRVSAPSYAACRRVAGTLRGESGSENRLVERRTILRRGLYARRIARAVGNPLPSWSRAVLSSSEVAGLWHLPSPFLKGVRIERSSVPRVPGAAGDPAAAPRKRR